MTHEATVELLSRLLDGEVSSAERQRAESLLREDESARAIYEGLREVRGALGQLADAAPPAHLGVLIERRVALAAEESGLWQRVDRRLRRFLVEPSFLPAFAVVIALAAMVYVLANGLDRFERNREPVILRPAPGAIEAPLPRFVDGRRFVFHSDRWVEDSLDRTVAATAPQRRLTRDETIVWKQEHPELTGLPQLGAVVLDLDGEIVELVFDDGGS